MEKYTNFITKKELIVEAKDPLLTNLFKKFNHSDLITYLKGLMVKYLDVNSVKKLLPKLDTPEKYSDYIYIYTKLEGHLDKLELINFKEIKKLLKKSYESSNGVKDIEDKSKENKESNEDEKI